MCTIQRCENFGRLSIIASIPTLVIVGRNIVLPSSSLLGGALCGLGLFALPLSWAFHLPLSSRNIVLMSLSGLLSAGFGVAGAAIDPKMNISGMVLTTAGVGLVSAYLLFKSSRSNRQGEGEQERQIEIHPLRLEEQEGQLQEIPPAAHTS